MDKKNLEKLIELSLAVELEQAKQAGMLGYMARALTQATLPHSKITGNEFKRMNGLFRLTITADSEVGLPYGSIPRLLLAWMATEAIKTKSRYLVLGKTLSSFMEDIGLVPTGGRWGTISRLKDQMKRLFSSAISCTYDDGNHWVIKNINPVSSADVWWSPMTPNQLTMFESSLVLNEEFFKEIISNPVPVDMRVLKKLKRSPLALDIYCWLTYRLSYLKETTMIAWSTLKLQFGANYSSGAQGERNFKKAFLRELRKVSVFYPKANFQCLEEGLILKESKPHIPKC